MKQMTFLDLCSGIGGFRLGLERAGHKCIGYCEYDKFARASYEAMYDTEGEWKAHDVTKLKPKMSPMQTSGASIPLPGHLRCRKTAGDWSEKKWNILQHY